MDLFRLWMIPYLVQSSSSEESTLKFFYNKIKIYRCTSLFKYINENWRHLHSQRQMHFYSQRFLILLNKRFLWIPRKWYLLAYAQLHISYTLYTCEAALGHNARAKEKINDALIIFMIIQRLNRWAIWAKKFVCCALKICAKPTGLQTKDINIAKKKKALNLCDLSPYWELFIDNASSLNTLLGLKVFVLSKIFPLFFALFFMCTTHTPSHIAKFHKVCAKFIPFKRKIFWMLNGVCKSILNRKCSIRQR